MATPEPERIRWVRYAADCAEHVLHLTGSARPHAAAAIRAARAWADKPTYAHRETARQAAHAAHAAHAAACAAGYAAYATHNAGSATNAEYIATCAADCARIAAADYEAERAWQAERRKFYGLPED